MHCVFREIFLCFNDAFLPNELSFNAYVRYFIWTDMASSSKKERKFSVTDPITISPYRHNKIIKSAVVNPCKNETPIKLWWLNINETIPWYEVDSRLYIAYFICGFSGSKLPFNIKRYVHRTHIFFKVQSFGYFAKYVWYNIQWTTCTYIWGWRNITYPRCVVM